MMKVLCLTLALCFAATMVFAEVAPSNATVETAPAAVPAVEAPATPPPAPVIERVSLSGEIIDNACAESQKTEEMLAFLKKHTKKCVLKCAASGYSLYANGMLLKFDAASNAKVEEFLKNSKSKLKVVVEADKVENTLSLISIKNQ